MDKRLFLTDEERKSIPSKKQIRKFWDSEEGIELLSKKTGIVRSYQYGCYACGFLYDLEKCHIVAHAKGGSLSVKNLHLLCGNCHKESEFFDTGDDRYWRWFRKKYIRDYKEPFQYIENELNLVDLSLKQILKLFYMGKKEEAIKIIREQSGDHTVENIKKILEKMIPTQEFNLSDEQAEKLANGLVEMMNQRLFSEYHENEWEGALPDRDTN